MSTVKLYRNEYEILARTDWDFPKVEQDPLSRIHPYPARFIREIPRSLIESLGCPQGTIILDPFCGSGTTIVEAQRSGIESVGIDINPIACLISRVKTQPLQVDNFINAVNRVSERARILYASDIAVPEIPNIDHWFGRPVQKALSALILSCKHERNKIIKDALRLAVSSIIVKVSNQDSDTRYAAVHRNTEPNDVFDLFVLAGERIAHVKRQGVSARVDVMLKDILSVNDSQFQKRVGLVVTSPPYPNAYEYWLYHKYRMWWLGYNPIKVREYEIGARPHYQKKNGQTEVDFCRQMEQVFALLVECLVNGGHICFIVGRSIIRGRLIDNRKLIQDIGERAGLSLVADITRNISASRKSFNLTYGKINHENILIFKKEF